jgi:uncharacterized protein
MTAQDMQIKCPRCGKSVSWGGNPYRPFCSERCRLVDLGRWADEEYRIAGSRAVKEDEGEEEGQDDRGKVIPFPKNHRQDND